MLATGRTLGGGVDGVLVGLGSCALKLLEAWGVVGGLRGLGLRGSRVGGFRAFEGVAWCRVPVHHPPLGVRVQGGSFLGGTQDPKPQAPRTRSRRELENNKGFQFQGDGVSGVFGVFGVLDGIGVFGGVAELLQGLSGYKLEPRP